MILKGLFHNRGGYMGLGKRTIWIVLFLCTISMVMLSHQIFAVKSNQYYPPGNYTCEQFEDSVLWGAAATKTTGAGITYVNWTPGNSCPGVKHCDMANITNYVRFINVGPTDDTTSTGRTWIWIANTTQTDARQNGTRHSASLNTT